MPHRGDFRGLMPSPRRRPAAGGSPAGVARTSAPAPRQEAARDPGGWGIRVSDVAVGVIATPVNAATPADPAKGHRLQEIVPLHRMGEIRAGRRGRALPGIQPVVCDRLGLLRCQGG